MDNPKKLERAKQAIDLIATAEDHDSGVRKAMMDDLVAYAVEAKAKVDAQVAADIAAATGG